MTIQFPAAEAMIDMLSQETPRLLEEGIFKSNIQCLLKKITIRCHRTSLKIYSCCHAYTSDNDVEQEMSTERRSN
jgi:hypothetical protein